MTDRIYHVLFLCTGNSARSIMAEAILSRLGAGRFCAHSAGSHPKGEVHPMALEVLRERGFDTSGFRSKSWEEFTKPGAPEPDFVFTLCDMAVGEACPAWPGRTVVAHCGLEDPADFEGPEDEQRRIFRHTYEDLERRIALFASLPPASIDIQILQARLDELAKGETPVGRRARSRR